MCSIKANISSSSTCMASSFHTQEMQQLNRLSRISEPSLTLKIKGTSTTTLASTLSPSPTVRSIFRNLIWLTKFFRTWTSHKGRRYSQLLTCSALFSNDNFHSLPLNISSTTTPTFKISTSLRRAYETTSTMQISKLPASTSTPAVGTAPPSNNLLDTSAKPATMGWFLSEPWQFLRSVCWRRIMWELVQADRKQWHLNCKKHNQGMYYSTKCTLLYGIINYRQ